MPIVIKDFTWEETDSMVFISVPLKGVQPHKVDIFSTDDYIKVSFPPYIFECFLFALVDDEESAAQIGNGVVVFKLRKCNQMLWGRLQHQDSEDKNKLRTWRDRGVEFAQKRSERQEKEKAENKREQQSYAVREQMRIEHEEKERIEREKDREIQKATDELDKWKEEQKRLATEEKEKVIKEHEEKMKIAAEEIKRAKVEQEEIITDRKSMRKNKKKNIFDEEAQGQQLRETGKIKVNFSHRVFPTAARESTAPEEDEWLRKQAESRRIIELENSDLTEEEKNPVWLRDKGNEFFKAGNYQSALNAYTHAIRMNYKMHSLYSNRAACHLKMRNLFKCIEDCERALELLNPPVPQNAQHRVRAHIRRGTAFCQLEMYAEGLMDYEAAIKIDPKNQKLEEDAAHIRKIIQGEPAS